MQINFLRCCFSSVLVFSKTYDCTIISCFNVQAVAKKQRQMLEELKQIFFFSRNYIYHANDFSEVLLLKCFSVLRNVQYVA